MSIALVISGGFGNGAFNGTIKDVVLRGYAIGEEVITPDITFGAVSLIDAGGQGLSSSIDDTGQGVTSLITSTIGVVSLINEQGQGVNGPIDDSGQGVFGAFR